MTRRHFLLVGLLLAGATSAVSLPGLSDPPTRAILPPVAMLPTAAKKAPVVRDFGSLPLSFESNQGQTDAKVRFLTHSGDNTLFLTPSEAVFSMPAPLSAKSREKSASRKDKKSQTTEQIAYVTLRMQMVGSDPKAIALMQQPRAGRVNYLIGNDPGKWHAGVPTFGRVGFQGVYPGVDLVYYGNQKHLEYDFVIAPHADPKQINLHFTGAQDVRLNAAGALVVRVQGRELKWWKPTVYQQDATGKHAVTARFCLKTLPGGQAAVRFALGLYDTSRPLVIDPVLRYSTYLGGSNEDYANSIAVDTSGNAYLAGYAGSLNFPTSSGAFQHVKNGAATSYNAFVTKLNSTGTALVYSTYLGGSSADSASGIAVDSGGNAYVTGYAGSTDFPTTAGAFQRVNNGQAKGNRNAFITRLDANGDALVYSTYLGGLGGASGGDQASCIAIDGNGNAYVAGRAGSTDFPVTSGAFQRVNSATGLRPSTAFVTELNSGGTALVYSTYLGGSGRSGTNGDNAFGLAIDSGGNAYVAGRTASPDFPLTANALQRVNNAQGSNASDAFVTKLNSTGVALLYSSYLGGSNYDVANAIAIDSRGNAYVTGYAGSTDFPITEGAFQGVKSGQASYNAFMTKVYIASIFPDFNNDGFTDLLLQNASTNAIISWFMNGSIFTGGAYFSLNPPSDYTLVGTGDFGFTELGVMTLVFQSNITNKIIFWYTAGADDATITGGDYVNVTPPAGWKLVGIGDFNGDGKSDLVVQNQITYQIAIYFMSGPYYQGGVLLPYHPPVGWRVAGVGDFNGDGQTDIAFQIQNTGQIALWYMNGTTYFNGLVMPAVAPAGWKIVAVGDYNGDGVADLVFQSPTSNQGMVWYLSPTGGVLSSAQFSTHAPPGWNFAGPR